MSASSAKKPKLAPKKSITVPRAQIQRASRELVARRELSQPMEDFEIDEAINYIQEHTGAAKSNPFKGHCMFADRDVVKAAGGEFSGGVWVAKNFTAFEAMVATSKWFPYHCENVKHVVTVMRTQRIFEEDRDMKSRVAKKEEVQTEDQKEQTQREMIGIKDDEPWRVKMLWDKYGIPEHCIRPAMVDTRFGPRGGISDAFRLCRALHHKIITPGDVIAGKFNQVDEAVEAARRKRRAARMKADEERVVRETGSSSVGNTASAVRVTSGAPGAAAFEREAHVQVWMRKDYRAPKVALVVTSCSGCGREIWDQFEDCDCGSGVGDPTSRAWIKCRLCGAFAAKYADGKPTQACKCRPKKPQVPPAPKPSSNLSASKHKAIDATSVVPSASVSQSKPAHSSAHSSAHFWASSNFFHSPIPSRSKSASSSSALPSDATHSAS